LWESVGGWNEEKINLILCNGFEKKISSAFFHTSNLVHIFVLYEFYPNNSKSKKSKFSKFVFLFILSIKKLVFWSEIWTVLRRSLLINGKTISVVETRSRGRRSHHHPQVFFHCSQRWKNSKIQRRFLHFGAFFPIHSLPS